MEMSALCLETLGLGWESVLWLSPNFCRTGTHARTVSIEPPQQMGLKTRQSKYLRIHFCKATFWPINHPPHSSQCSLL